MIEQPQSQKHFASAAKRFLQSSIENFLDKEFPRTFGPVIRQKMAEKIVALVDRQLPRKDHLRPGQCVWNAVSATTRPGSPNCRLVPVILTLVDPSDIEELAHGTRMSKIAQKSTARICREAFEQGALLSMRDIGLLVWRSNAHLSVIRKKWEAEHGSSLPRPPLFARSSTRGRIHAEQLMKPNTRSELSIGILKTFIELKLAMSIRKMLTS
jgi:hypothetical protein